MSEMQAVVHAHWAHAVAARRRRRRLGLAAMVSMCAIAALAASAVIASTHAGAVRHLGTRWAWDEEPAPAFDIQNASLASFLNWIARIKGRKLVYQSSCVQAAAAGIILHGSIDGLSPDVALTAVLATTSLRHDQTKPEVIEIVFAEGIDTGLQSSPTRCAHTVRSH